MEHPKFRFVHGNITDQSLMLELVSTVDIIVNFAAESHVDRSIESGFQFVKTNVLGTQVLLDSAVKNKISKFIQISTDEVYGSISEGSWTEESILAPNSPYSASKAGADLLVLAYHNTYDLNVSITRCSNNYGPFQHPEKMIPASINRLLRGENIKVYGDGSNVRDWLHVTDHCRGIEAVMELGMPGEIYNIGGGRELSNLELAKLLVNQIGAREEQIEFISDRMGHDLRYSVNYTKLTMHAGYKPIIDFDSGIKDTILWYQENQNYWKL